MTLLCLSAGLALLTTQNPTQTPSPTQAPASNESFSLTWKPKEGDTLTYSTDATMDVGGTQAIIKSKTQEKVIKVDTDGTYSVQSSTLEGNVTYLGQLIPMAKPITVTLYKPTGQVIAISGQQTDATSYRSANLTFFKRPDAPVKVGDSWSIDIPADPKTGVVDMHGAYKVEGTEKVGDYDTVRVSAVNKELKGTIVGSVEATFWVNKADGTVVKSQTTWTNVTFPGAPAPVSGNMTTTRVAA